MLQTDNITYFDELTGQVLAHLYSTFPVPAHLLSKDYVDEAYTYNEHIMTDVASEQSEFFIATCEWLRQAGYIHTGEKDPNSQVVRDAVLSAKGLELLKVKPQNLTDGPTLGDELSKAARDGAKDAVKKSVGQVLGLGARFMWNGLSSM